VRSTRLRGVALVLTALAGPCLLAGVAAGQLTPPPTPVPPNGSPSPFISVLPTPFDPVREPEIHASAAILFDLGADQPLVSSDAGVRRPVASLTKLMTALVVLERAHPRDLVTVRADAVFDPDRYGASSILGLRAGERVRVGDLLYGLLLGSANDAAVALADHISGNVDAFVAEMNARAAELGMHDTHFRSPNGLDDRGYSSAEDLVTLVGAVREHALFRTIAATRFHTMPGPGGVRRRIQNRNVLLWLYPGATGVKTGFTAGAGYCLVATAERGNRRLLVVLLGEPSDAFSDAAAMLNHGFEAFKKHTFVRAGDSLGTVGIRGGAVPVRAADDLRALVAIASLPNVRRSMRIDPHVGFPPAVGQTVGILAATIGDTTIGTVPIEVEAVPAPVSAGDGPWWARAAATIGGAMVDVVEGLAT
jgi:serine-type D-Ala-D-Ala carboxypeptidase (penicillin-binding protein 5/6)